MVHCRLDDLLWERRMKLIELARLSGIDYTTLIRMRHQRGKGIQYHVLERLCKTLGCTPNDLFTVS